ncbi:aldose epimerase family protein [Autumnicola psychrophila]|uniref:Aldose 1-epimerase n=1 Tax=Autumnicola psychrophila TaxID=3075592 RepID=A0ABU3DPH9_9FLAO|nr:aldose epimerase family protein [Zunongwangia sp. F225]MDT0685621.1 aldose epimerase family protein [Zunongwangia sp. F225]
MKNIRKGLFAFALMGFALIFVQCKNEKKDENNQAEDTAENQKVLIKKSDFGTTPEGELVEMFTLTNAGGMEVKVITYGGRITSLKAPDKIGNYEDVVLGFDSIEQYTKDNPYFGALIGRYGNRIAQGRFSLDGEEYELAQNNGENHLHGGEKGFDKVIWNATPEEGENSSSLVLTYTSEDMEEGYPGKLDVTVTYTLFNDNSFDVNYEATTDKKTVINLTQHAYFNLSGDFSETILDHIIKINADKFVPVDENLIPTGDLMDVEDTPFDFLETKEVAEGINADNEQIQRGGGYDHNWVLNNQDSGMRFAASAYEPESGRFMEVYTDEPGMQFYTGNFLDGTLPAQGGGNYEKRTGFCFETQHYPDSPNQESFPSVVLEPGETYVSNTSFKFSVK